ncbi:MULTISPECIES: YjcZ-like family protein, partial [Vibrio]|uniref:YjcZ-like family protein n=1 Tax=Vibrio TaxID=662 RepID=UPI001CDC78DF
MRENDNSWFDKIDCIKDKAIVDLVNGLDVSRDHQKNFDSQSISSRLLNGLTGKNHAPQGEINKSLTEGLESTLSWLT